MKSNTRKILRQRKMRLETHGFIERKNSHRNGFHWVHPQYPEKQFSLKEAEERCEWLTDMTCRHLEATVRNMRKQLNQVMHSLCRHGELPQYREWSEKFADDEFHKVWDRNYVAQAGDAE